MNYRITPVLIGTLAAVAAFLVLQEIASAQGFRRQQVPQPQPVQPTQTRRPGLQQPANLPAVVSAKDVNTQPDDYSYLNNAPDQIRRPQRPANLPARQNAFQFDKNAAPKPYRGGGTITKMNVEQVSGGNGPKPYKVIIDPNSGLDPYDSPALRAQFVEDMDGARITSIQGGSPLRGTIFRPSGLKVGDVIGFLDGLPVMSELDLENHIRWTSVDYIDFMSGQWKRTLIYIW